MTNLRQNQHGDRPLLVRPKLSNRVESSLYIHATEAEPSWLLAKLASQHKDELHEQDGWLL